MYAKKVMIVDDEIIIAMDIANDLRFAGYEARVISPSGEKALDVLREYCPDIILMDIKLKGSMDGIETADKIKELYDIPVVYLSAYTDSDTITKAKKSESFGYVTKPYSLKSLQITIEMALYKHRAEKRIREQNELLERRVQQRTEELRLANQKLERANRLKDEFLANMSHELRTPLNTIKGMCEIMKEGMTGCLTKKQTKCIDSILESEEHLLLLITDILDVSKIEAGKLRLDINCTDIKSVCEGAIRLNSQLAARKRIRIHFDYDSSVGLASVDSLRLKQILVNLLNNAVKFTKKNGKVGLTVKGNLRKRNIRFDVWDTGIGVSEREKKQMFLPFVQFRDRQEEIQEGTGLGLALCRKLAKLHNGTISVESTINKGSKFTLTIPWSSDWLVSDLKPLKPLKNIEDNKVVSIHSKEKRSILLVEDNQKNLDITSMFLKNKGFRILIASSAKKALKSLKRFSPDIILMDIQMQEGLTGLNLISTIKRNKDTAGIPIIALTALAMSEDKKKCLDAGAEDYMSKPFNLQKLLEKINSMCENKIAYSINAS